MNGYIDFEGTTISPLWEVAVGPDWISDLNSGTVNWYGDSPVDQLCLWNAFHSTIAKHPFGSEWLRAYQEGMGFRRLTDHLELGVSVWGSADKSILVWVERSVDWAKDPAHRGMAMPEDAK